MSLDLRHNTWRVRDAVMIADANGSPPHLMTHQRAGENMKTDSMERLANRFVAAIEKTDRRSLESIYSTDAVVWHNTNNLEQSRDDNIAAIAKHADLFKSFQYADIRRGFFGGGFVQQHIARGVKSSGESFEVPVCMVVTVRGDQITRVDEYFDSAQDARPAQFR
jgi:ketosteroid isomerase-like protein